LEAIKDAVQIPTLDNQHTAEITSNTNTRQNAAKGGYDV